VQFRILGPLEVLDDHGRRLALGGPKQRTLLATLLLDAGAVLSADRLVDLLWGEGPPATARGVLQVYVANLRKLLEPGRAARAASSILRTQPPGYVLDLTGHTLDLAEFQLLRDEGLDVLARGDPAAAAVVLRQALAIWRGPAASDVAAEMGLQAALARLEEQRLTTLEQRIEVDLTLGRHAELAGELEGLVRIHPLRERLCGQLIIALYRCGRQAAALDAYRQARLILAEELGIDPSRGLQELERAVLAQDPSLEWSAPDRPASPPSAAGAVKPVAGSAAAPIVAPTRTPGEERKVVTLLWCGLVSIAAGAGRVDPEDTRAQLAPYQKLIRAEVERFGGTAERFLGQAVMGVFGAPVAHEDDAERAVRAGLRILEAVEASHSPGPGVGVLLRIGVSTGEALVAAAFRAATTEGLLAGEVVDAATRVAALAPIGGVAVDEATWRRTRRQVTYEPVGPAPTMPGGDAIQLWQAVAARSHYGTELTEPATPFFGREDELLVLQGLYRRTLREASLQLVTVTGEPGVGKSRLVRELSAFVDRQPELVAWRQGRCLPYGEGIAFWALGEVIKAEAGILESDGPDDAAAKLAACVEGVEERSGERRWLQARLAPLVGLADPDGTAARREEAFAAWRQFLEAVAATKPLVMVIEDLHWADDALLEFLRHVVEWSSGVPLLVLCTTRPELAERWASWGDGARNATSLALPPLPDEDIARLGAALLDQTVMPSELQSLLLERAGGNPLYAEEFLRLLIDQGTLVRIGRAMRLRRSDEALLPETVQALIAARLDTLSPSRKALLQDAAVVGQVFWSGALAAMDAEDETEVRAGLHELARRELLRPVRRSSIENQAEYAFWHVLVRDVAYGQLPRAAKADKHRRAAEWLEALAPDRADDRVEFLAHHWQAALHFAKTAGQETATLAERTRLAAREAGDRTFSVNSFAAAARWYAAAVELWPNDDPERPQLLLRLGETRLHNEWAGGELLADARDRLLAQGRLEAAAEAEALLGQLARLHGQGERAMAHHRRAAALLEGAGPSRAKAFALVSLAGALVQNGRSRDAIRVGRQALAIAESLGLDDVRARAHNTIGCARSDSGDPGGAIADLERAVAIAVEASSPQSSDAYGNLATTVIALGDLDRGIELRAKAREVAERFGMVGDLRWARAEQVEAYYWQGRWEEALRGAEDLIPDAKADAWQLVEQSCRLVRGKIALARGDLAGALRDAEYAAELAERIREVHGRISALTFQAAALLAAGRVEDAGERASEVLASLADQKLPLVAQVWSGELAHVLRALGRPAELTDLAATVVTPTLWLQAATAIAAGHLERAAELYTEIGSLPDAAFARLRAAEQLLAAGRGPEATTQLEQARSFYRQVAARAYLREADGLATASA
jgi:DNA-binding SARP family transcriptional activator/class 3 adenylate cyclase